MSNTDERLTYGKQTVDTCYLFAPSALGLYYYTLSVSHKRTLSLYGLNVNVIIRFYNISHIKTNCNVSMARNGTTMAKPER